MSEQLSKAITAVFLGFKLLSHFPGGWWAGESNGNKANFSPAELVLE